MQLTLLAVGPFPAIIIDTIRYITGLLYLGNKTARTNRMNAARREKENITGIIGLIIADLNRRLEDRQLKIELTPEAESYIVEHAYDPVYGARPLKRYIQKYVETLSAKLILSGDVGMEDTIVIDVDDGHLKAFVKNNPALEQREA